MARKFQRSPLALAVLVLLHEAPMHPYRMQRLIKDRGKDQVINVEQRASLYQTIERLLREGLITLRETEQAAGFPERTLYQLTDEGHTTAVAWLREMVSTPEQEYPNFPAAMSLLPLLTPEDALKQFELREARLKERLAAIEKDMLPELPRLFLLESEYLRTTLEAELIWVQGVMVDLRSGALTWTLDWAHPFDPPEKDSF